MNFRNTQNYFTLLGIGGLLCWALSATLVLSVTRIPTYQTLTSIFLVSFIGSSIYTSYNRSWHKLAHYPLYLWVVGVLCVCGNEALYIISFKNAPAAQVDIINYLWPLLVVCCSPALPTERFQMKYVIAGVIAFLGIYVMLSGDDKAGVYSIEYLYGYIMAFCAAATWAIYTLVSRAYGKGSPELIGIYCGFGLFFACAMHIQYEQFVSPNWLESCALLFMGLTTHSLAYFLWDTGVKYGNFRLLSVLSYANPVLSVIILIYAGFADASAGVFFAGICVFIAGCISILPWPILRKIFFAKAVKV